MKNVSVYIFIALEEKLGVAMTQKDLKLRQVIIWGLKHFSPYR